MKKTCAIIGLAIVCFAGCGQREQVLTAKLKDAERLTQKHETSLSNKDDAIQRLTDKIHEMARVLTNTSARLNDATERIAAFEATEAARLAQSKAEIPKSTVRTCQPPNLHVVTNTLGQIDKTIVFPALLNERGELLGTNLEYKRIHGSRLVFATTDFKLLAFDVEAVHHDVLDDLGINPNDAKGRQAKIESENRAYMQAWLSEGASRAEKERVRQEERRKAAVEAAEKQAKVDEDNRRQAFQEALAEQQVMNDTARADAALRMGDAAMIRALNPPRVPLINNNQINVR